ncbi:MAG: hypothetical protein AB7E49_10295 [Campylobacterales bacterium]
MPLWLIIGWSHLLLTCCAVVTAGQMSLFLLNYAHAPLWLISGLLAALLTFSAHTRKGRDQKSQAKL